VSFQDGLTQVLQFEGGYTVDDGGPTNYGITQDTYNAYRFKSVRSITPVEVATIYQTMYWSASGCDQIDPVSSAVSEIHFDCAVNCGVGTAIGLLQGMLKVTTDHKFGPITLAALVANVKVSELNVINGYLDARVYYYEALSTFDVYGKSWLNRVDVLRAKLTPGKV
jgi:lysozyme family protein